LSPREVDEMDIITHNTLMMAIEPIESQELLVSMKVSDWPNMKKPDRTKLHKSVYKTAYRIKEKKITIDDFAATIKADRGSNGQ
jgi:hypothetical protein